MQIPLSLSGFEIIFTSSMAFDHNFHHRFLPALEMSRLYYYSAAIRECNLSIFLLTYVILIHLASSCIHHFLVLLDYLLRNVLPPGNWNYARIFDKPPPTVEHLLYQNYWTESDKTWIAHGWLWRYQYHKHCSYLQSPFLCFPPIESSIFSLLVSIF